MIVGALITLVTLAALIVAWRRTLPGFQNFTLKSPSLASVEFTARSAAESAVLLGLLIVPAVLLAGPERVLRAAWARARWATLVVCLYTFVLVARDYLLPGRSPDFLSLESVVLHQWTLALSRQHSALVPESLLKLLALVGVLSLIVLLCGAIPPTFDAAERVRTRSMAPKSPALAIVALATVGFAAASILASALQTPFYPRYLLPLIPLLAILVLSSESARRRTARWTRVATVTALVPLAVFGAAYASASASFDGTKWKVAEAVAKQTKNPEEVDGGFEWNNYLAGTVRYMGVAHPRAACIVLIGGARPQSNARAALRARHVWNPADADFWIVAWRRARC
jgi:hypothetical protein